MSLAQRAWIEEWLNWCVHEFGLVPIVRGPVLPTSGFLPHGYAGTPAQIADLVAGVCEVMAIVASELTLELFDRANEDGSAERRTERVVGHYRVEDGQTIIGLDRTEAADARYLTAIIAHEMSHVRLLGEGRVDPDRKDGERLTDLLTVFFGFGIFTTNAAFRFGAAARGWSVRPLGHLDDRMLNAARNDGAARLGYLTQREFGYALACYAWLRHEPDPPWAVHLNPGPREYLRQSLAFMASESVPGMLPTRRTGYGHSSIRVEPKTDRPRHRPARGAHPPDAQDNRTD
ncbi:hypothetical protein [Actinomadura pelletieri]|uniref:hypothetical protein n=1 Tax=Actinomadura pelletieri TaxID=111805 RepID=UPI000EAD3BF0|nr:hypothetical protein [Actinomadura pelletieri]